MKKYYVFLLSIIVLAGLSSCSSLRVEKRHYAKGWYVDFGTDKKSPAPDTEIQQVTEENTPQKATTSTVATPAAVTVNAPEVHQPAAAPGEITPPANAAEENAVTNTATQKENAPAVNEKEKEDPAVPEPAQSDVELILLVILAILVPPIAVYLVQGLSAIFWITLICWLLGGVFFFGPWGYGYIGGLGLVAVVLALLVVFGVL
jgi:uncharacterized membrane protein YqaE (UPF0057 family)